MNDSNADMREDYNSFVNESLDSGIIWGLRSQEGWAVCASNDYPDKEVILFWSKKNKALEHAIDDWSDYLPVKIGLDDFIDSWLHGMDEDGVFAGVNWNIDLSGVEIEPIVLIDDFLDDED